MGHYDALHHEYCHDKCRACECYIYPQGRYRGRCISKVSPHRGDRVPGSYACQHMVRREVATATIENGGDE